MYKMKLKVGDIVRVKSDDDHSNTIGRITCCEGNDIYSIEVINTNCSSCLDLISNGEKQELCYRAHNLEKIEAKK